MSRTKSKRYEGVYYNDLKSGDRSFFITYRDADNKQRLMNVGTRSGGIDEKFAFNERLRILNQIKFGDNPNVKTRNKRKVKLVNSFDMVAAKFFREKETEIQAKSLKEFKSKYKNHIQPYLGNMDIDQIEKKHVDQIKRDKLKETATDPKKILAPKTINMILDIVTSIYNFAIEEKIYKGANLGSQVKNIKNINNERDKYLDEDEVKLLLDTVKEDYTLYMFCILSLTTGARVSSVVNIRKRDLNLKERTIKINDIKGGESTYYALIKESYFHFFKSIFNNSEIGSNQYLVDVTGEDTEHRVKNIQRDLKPILDELFNKGLSQKDTKNRVVLHTLRHTFASLLAIHNTPIYTIKKLMNHKDIKDTLRYAKLQQKSGLEFLNQINY